MPLPTIANTIRVAIKLGGTGVDDLVVNVIHVHETGSNATQDVADVISAAWATAWKDLIPNIFEWSGLTLTRLNGTAGVDCVWNGDQPASTADSAPMQAALCASWRTGLAGRSFRGRSYIGPIGANRIDPTAPDHIDPGVVTTFTSQANGLIDDLTTGDFPLEVASYKLSETNLVDTVKINPLVCTVRKRVNGR